MTDRDRLTDAGILIVGAAAAILTFTTLRDLAEAVGITGTVFWVLPLGWLVPVTVDVAGIVATRVWLRGQGPKDAVRFARWLAWVCIGASVAGNAGQHAMAAYRLVPHWTVVVLVSATPPAVLGAMVHLGHLIRRPARADRDTGGTARDDPIHTRIDAGPVREIEQPHGLRAESEPTPAGVHAGVSPTPDRTDDDILAALRAITDRTGRPSERRVRDEFRVGRNRAQRLLAALDEAVPV